MTNMFERFRALGTALVSDVLDEAGYHSQTLDPTLGPVGAFEPACGPAICVSGERSVTTRTAAGPDATLPLYNLPTLAQPGGILVFATSGFRGGGVTGELLALDLKSAGVVGMVTDGMVRDKTALAQIGLNVVAAGVIPTNGARRFQITGWGQSVTLPGPEGGRVSIAPGDLVLMDADGVLIIPNDAAARVLEMAEELARKEEILKSNTTTQSAEVRAKARAERMSHMVWLRHPEVSR
ncbi:RraA family protein [Salipiger mangrovisoli]|uniref:Putative 4-hydroxy-4-methyl-2-oxoglutarate aldolase n=1 Tax=Salipiger mangrovisoli TaxID=2865933 RepID=A0ABR9XAR4_9RHOB|nr:RraA family protein [Salipiger mangrovisoli]MBE9640701.1 RraA family protein [Salipiger mangrovisoli]